MSKYYSRIRNFVKSKLKEHTYKSMRTYLYNHPPALWGEQQPHDYLERNFVLLMYKHMQAWGYQKVLREVKLGKYKLTYHSFKKNCERIRKTLSRWGDMQIVLGTKRYWTACVKHVRIPDCLRGTLFWVDSFDLPLSMPEHYSRKDPRWSYKLNRYGRRYMCFRNGRSCFALVFGGYSPKIYDGHFLEAISSVIDGSLGSSSSIGDAHFEYANQSFRSHHIYTNLAVPDSAPNLDSESDRDVLEKLTKEQQTYNKAHQRLRARVENSFGIIKQLFPSLSKPWRERPKQLDYLVKIAMGVHNYNKTHK